MSEVKRYRHFPAQYARMFIDTLPSGEYVKGADYDALAADNKRLREALREVMNDSALRSLMTGDQIKRRVAALAGRGD